MLVALSIDYRTLADKSHLIYALTLGLLVYVLLFGVVRGGARRWIPLGVLQPAALRVRQARRGAGAGEVLRRKPARCSRRAADLDDRRGAGRRAAAADCAAAGPRHGRDARAGVPGGGATSAGLPMRVLGILALAGVLAAPIAWKFALKDYQK